MKTPKIAEAMNHLDDDLITEATREEKRTFQTAPFLKWGSLAACFCLLIVSAIILIPMLQPEGPVSPADPLYKDVHVQGSEIAIVWPWEYMTVYEKYRSLSYGGKTYAGRGREISPHLLGEALGTAQARGYDLYTEKEYTENFAVYRIHSVSEAYLIAAEMDGKFYVFDAHEPNAFATLGDMMDAFSMAQNIELNRFSVHAKNQKTKNYALADGNAVWEILNGCKNAKAVDDELWKTPPMYISFTVTSEALGVYKNVMYVTEDGYLRTNAFDYANLFEIGEEAAKQIIDHVQKHAEETAAEPYQITIAGKITAVGENSFTLDTTPVCVNKHDGKTYTITADALGIRRVLEFEKVGVGDIVIVTYDGKIKDGNLIEGATNMQKGFLSDESGNVLIPE